MLMATTSHKLNGGSGMLSADFGVKRWFSDLSIFWKTLICHCITEEREVLRMELPIQWLTQGLVQLSLESMGAFLLVLQHEIVQQLPSCAGNSLSGGKYDEKNVPMFLILNWYEKKGHGKAMQFQTAKRHFTSLKTGISRSFSSQIIKVRGPETALCNNFLWSQRQFHYYDSPVIALR